MVVGQETSSKISLSLLLLCSKEGCAIFRIHEALRFCAQEGVIFYGAHTTLVKTAICNSVILAPSFLSLGEKLLHKITKMW